MFNFLNPKKNQQGEALLLAVVILTAAVLVMAASVFSLGLGELDMGYTYQCGEETFAIADGCLEETLRRIKINPSYSSGVLALGHGSCTIGVNSIGNQRIINVIASSTASCNKKITATSTISNSEVILNAWSEQ
jgi:hypothetical protein